MKKILICGGKDFTNKKALYDALNILKKKHGDLSIIHGNAQGTDMLAEQWVKDTKVPCSRFPADQDKYGKRAEHMHNQKMLDVGQPDVVIAFPGGKGTTDMKRRTLIMNIELIEIRCPKN